MQWGLELAFAPCQVWTKNLDVLTDFPPTCECLAECHALNHRTEYAANCVNASGRWLEPAHSKTAVHPWRDPFFDGRWIKQARADDERLTEASRLRFNLELAARLQADGNETRERSLCSGHGLHTVAMPWAPGRGRNRVHFCHCFPGWFGDECEFGPEHEQLPVPREKRLCTDGCGGRGKCRLNWCHCVAGTWGEDCRLGTPDSSSSALSGTALSGLSPGPALTAPLATRRGPVPAEAAAAGRSLRIYVYSLPPEFTTWLAAHFRHSDSGRWDDSWLYSLDIRMHRWLLASPYRTLDPEAADFFFVPLYLSLGFYDFEFGLYWLNGRGVNILRRAVGYTQQTWPYFNRSRGADHLLVMTNDKGATFMRGAVPALAHVSIITQWGWKRPHIHLPGQDIVVPPMLSPAELVAYSPHLLTLGSQQSPPPSTDAPPFRYLLSFVGSVRLKNRGYSFGVRQAVFRRFYNHSAFLLRDLRGQSTMGPQAAMPKRDYYAVQQASKFCLAPSGMGFSTRVYEAIAQGCVPLIIQDEPDSQTEVEQAFEELLPYADFSLRLRQADIPRLPELLAAVPNATWLQLRRGLGCVWPRMLWLRDQGLGGGADQSSARELRAFDAWETLVATLTMRVAQRRKQPPPPFEWRASVRSCTALREPAERTLGGHSMSV